jgi:imidazolonepropionase-like amidohydrolase
VRARPILLVVLAVACGREPLLVERPPSGPRSLVIRNVRVFDARNARLADGPRDVVVRGGRIAGVSPPGAPAPGLRELDGAGGTLLPGLVDVHAHTGSSSDPPGKVSFPDVPGNLASFLYAGVTTVLDLGSLAPDVFRERAKVADGTRLGPHLLTAGPIFTAPGGHPAEILRTALPWYLRWYVLPRATREVATPEEARAAVAALLPERPDVLKIAVDAGTDAVPRLSPATIKAIVDAGHAAGVRSMVHIGDSTEAVDAIAAGADALAHAPWREEISDAAVAALAAAQKPVVVTIAIGDLLEGPRPAADFLPIEREVATPTLIAALGAPVDFGGEAGEKFRRAVVAGHAARRRSVQKLRAAGVTILAGSDACNPGALPGAGLHLELARLVEAGMPAGEALRAATWTNARFLGGESADFGEIAEGKRADLLLVAGDPAANVADLGRITHVVLDGAVLERRKRP